MHKKMKPLFFYNFSNGIVSNQLMFSLICSLFCVAVFTPIVTPEETEEKTAVKISNKKIADVDPDTPGDQSGWAATFEIVSGPDPGPDFINDIFIENTPATEHPLFKSFGKTSDDPIIYTLIVYDETPPANEDPPSGESSTVNSPTPPSQREPKTARATSTEPSTDQATKVPTPDESSTGNTQAQQAAPQSSTDNTQAQQAAPQSSTGNTQTQQAAPQSSTGNTPGTPHSVTTNTPADTTGTQTPDTPEQQAPDLVVDAFEVNKDVLDAGESFTISAVVRNQSEGSSSTGTLTYYQYFDDKSVEKVGESDIASLAAGEATDVSITLTAPETSGTHSYYACVSTNCTSTFVKISVRSEIKELVISSGD
ncbi:MAG: hypothetical protein OYL97_06635, partial [Candidatus Poribacteria bacterium]|nr:hypothetical protein [Candidatus Poribacteria bacterium]